ncbi:response regulator transcription factor [Enterococcus sp. LJL120]
MKKILVIDDEIELLETLKDYLTLSGYQVFTAENPLEARAKLLLKPDLILLDIAMPEMDGITFCKEIRGVVSCPIIFLSAQTDEESRLDGLMAGGDDYLLKPFSLKELAMRVTAHLRREERQKDQGSLGFFGALYIKYDQKEIWIENQLVPLTKTEYQIAELLARHPGQVFNREEIYDALWGFDKEGDATIITEHVRRLRTKFKKMTAQEIIQTVWGLGYKWIG